MPRENLVIIYKRKKSVRPLFRYMEAISGVAKTCSRCGVRNRNGVTRFSVCNMFHVYGPTIFACACNIWALLRALGETQMRVHVPSIPIGSPLHVHVRNFTILRLEACVRSRHIRQRMTLGCFVLSGDKNATRARRTMGQNQVILRH